MLKDSGHAVCAIYKRHGRMWDWILASLLPQPLIKTFRNGRSVRRERLWEAWKQNVGILGSATSIPESEEVCESRQNQSWTWRNLEARIKIPALVTLTSPLLRRGTDKVINPGGGLVDSRKSWTDAKDSEQMDPSNASNVLVFNSSL